MPNRDASTFRYLGLDLRSRTRRRLVIVFTWTLFVVLVAALTTLLETEFLSKYLLSGFALAIAALLLFSAFSVFGVLAIPEGRGLPLWRLRHWPTGPQVLLRSLDDWALYRHDAPLSDLSEEQQADVLRAYRVGNYFFPASKSRDSHGIDTRYMAARNEATTSALRWIFLFSVFAAAVHAQAHQPLQRADVVLGFLEFGFFAMNLPASIFLWNEPDPREEAAASAVPQPAS